MLQRNPGSVIVGTGTGVTAYTELERCQNATAVSRKTITASQGLGRKRVVSCREDGQLLECRFAASHDA